MTITSTGYAGTVGEEQWARMVPRLGAWYTVNGYSDFRVSIGAGTRTVSIAPGGAQSLGIYDTSNAVEAATLASVPSGTRWDMIVLRRTWATKTTSIAVVQGGSSKVLPARNTDAGTVNDQPLALVRVIAGSTSIQEIVDLRVSVNNGGAVAWDDLVRSYMTHLGTVVRIGDVVWSRVTNVSGSPVWVSDDMSDTGWVAVPRQPNWLTVAEYPLRVRRNGNLVELRGAVRAAAGANKNAIATIPAGFRPAGSVPLGSTHMTHGAHGQQFVNSGGLVWVDDEYRSGANPGDQVVMLHGFWFLG